MADLAELLALSGFWDVKIMYVLRYKSESDSKERTLGIKGRDICENSFYRYRVKHIYSFAY